MVGDLRSRLEPIGRVDVLDAVGDKAMEYFSSLPAGADAAVMDKRAMTLRQIGEVRVSQGRYDEGLAAFREAMAIYERLTANSDPDPDRMYNLAHTHFWIADAHFRRLDYESAEQEIIAYRDTARWLAENYPDNNDYLLELAQAESNLGTLHYRRSQFVDARQRFISAEAAARQIIASEPGNETYISTLAATVSWLGSAEIALGNLEKGTALHREMIDIGRQTVASSDDIRERQFLAVDMQVLSADLHRMGLLDEALSVDAEAVDILGELVEFDPENRNWATSLARGQSIMARHRLTACRLNGVTELLDESQRTLEQQIAVDPSDADTRVDLANVGVERARLAAIQKEIGESRDLATRSRSTLLDVFRDRSDDVMARRDVVRATSALVQVYTIAGDHGQAAEVAASMIDELSGLNLEDADALAWLANIRETGGEEIQAQGLTSYRHPALMPECGQNDGTDSGH
jgi:tetratricopeptide (TPR) repeat protein